MKILIIDNNMMEDSWGCENLRVYARLVTGATVTVRRAPNGDLPASAMGYDRIVVSGSVTSANETAPWIDRLLAFIRSAVDAGKPFLGVCYGHQMLARALGGASAVRSSETPEFGWSRIQVTGKSPLLKGLPQEFHSFSSHCDEVAQLPPGAQPFARSERCAIQGFALSDKPAFGIQFHPEKGLDECEQSLVCWKKDFSRRDTLEPKRSKALYREEIGKTIFGNFFEL
jgi:GMP synthase (glutamine-hydrolysing)